PAQPPPGTVGEHRREQAGVSARDHPTGLGDARTQEADGHDRILRRLARARGPPLSSRKGGDRTSETTSREAATSDTAARRLPSPAAAVRRLLGLVGRADLSEELEAARRDALLAAQHAERLQEVTAGLAASATTEEIADVIISQGIPALAATTGILGV